MIENLDGNGIGTELTIVDANELLEKIGEYAATIEKYESERDALIEKYQQKIYMAKEICERNCFQERAEIEILTEQLRRYATENLPKGKRSIELPNGRLAFKKQSRYSCNGEAVNGQTQELIEFARKNAPQYLKKLAWSDFAKNLIADGEKVYYKETGELIEGLKFERMPDSFTVKTA